MNGGSASSVMSEAVREIPYRQKRTELQMSIADLDKASQELENRLGTVLLAKPEEAKNIGQGAPCPPMSPLVSDLYEHTCRVQEIVCRVRSILSRLEI